MPSNTLEPHSRATAAKLFNEIIKDPRVGQTPPQLMDPHALQIASLREAIKNDPTILKGVP